jgi:putative tricarboxylic transport membrane protein
MNKRERDRMGAGILIAAAVGICYGSVRLSLGGFHTPGPGFFSFLAGIVLGVLSLLSFIQSFKELPGDERKPFWPHPRGTLKVMFVFVALILYVVAMDSLGFCLTTFLFLGVLLRGIEPQRWSVVFSISVLGVLISYGIFQYWLDMQLPRGFLGF